MNNISLPFVFFAFIAFNSFGSEGENTQLTTGISTVLSLEQIRAPRYEGHPGETVIRLADSKNGDELFVKKENGIFVCLGFNRATGDYVIGKARAESGILPFAVFYTLNETKRILRPPLPDVKNLRFYSSQCSPTGSFIALIGWEKNTDKAIKLIIFNTKKEKFRIIGEAPMPPPDNEWKCDLWKERELEDGWGWHFPFHDTYITLEPGIITFPDEDTLQVSYGEDTCRKRSDIRTAKQWKLGGLF
jgi:hypothetical protein